MHKQTQKLISTSLNCAGLLREYFDLPVDTWIKAWRLFFPVLKRASNLLTHWTFSSNAILKKTRDKFLKNRQSQKAIE